MKLSSSLRRTYQSSQTKPQPAQKDASKSSMPRMGEMPAQKKATATGKKMLDSLSMRSYFLASLTAQLDA